MADARRPVDPPELDPEDDIDELFGGANPNPARVGCPPRDVLIALARRQRPIEDPGYEHLAGCSECYQEFRRIQQGDAPHGRGSVLSGRGFLAVAAALLLVALAGVWLLSSLRRDRSPGPVAREDPRPAAQPIALDLRAYTVARTDQQPRDAGPVAFPRGELSATMLLPVGSEVGAYDIQLLDADSRPRASAKGDASIRDHITTLHATIDLREVPPGSYQLAIRHSGEDWRLFPALVK